MWELYFTKQAIQDSKKISDFGLKLKVQKLLDLIKIDPFAYPPKFEILKGRLKGFVSRRINDQHRLVYVVDEKNRLIKILKMWTHYE